VLLNGQERIHFARDFALTSNPWLEEPFARSKQRG
jgi:hypothetical protein